MMAARITFLRILNVGAAGNFIEYRFREGPPKRSAITSPGRSLSPLMGNRFLLSVRIQARACTLWLLRMRTAQKSGRLLPAKVQIFSLPILVRDRPGRLMENGLSTWL